MRALGASWRVLAILTLLSGTLNGWAPAQTPTTTGDAGAPAEGAVTEFAGPGSAASIPAVTPDIGDTGAQPPAPTPFLLMKALGIPDDSPLRIYGWIQNSYTGNPNGTPKNGEDFVLFPNHLANQWMGNQYYLVLERTMTKTDELDYGFRLDTLLGNDAEFTHAQHFLDGLVRRDRFANLDLPQTYGEVHLPVLTPKGVDVKFGRWYNFAGFETVTAIQRPLLSWAFTMPYFPFTFSGVNAHFQVTDHVEFWAGAVNGPDRWFDRYGQWNPLAAMRLTSPDEKTVFTTVLTVGPSPTQIAGVPGTNARNQKTYLSNLLTHKWTERLSQAVELDLIVAEDFYSPVANKTFRNADYFAATTWLIYEFNDRVSGVARNDIFRDDQGSATGVADTYYESTLGLILKPHPWLWVRPEMRYNWAQFKSPFDNGTQQGQFTIAADVILLY